MGPLLSSCRLRAGAFALAGACLTVTSPAGIPNEFDLMLDREKLTRHCRVAWRGADRIGVAFDKPTHLE